MQEITSLVSPLKKENSCSTAGRWLVIHTSEYFLDLLRIVKFETTYFAKQKICGPVRAQVYQQKSQIPLLNLPIFFDIILALALHQTQTEYFGYQSFLRALRGETTGQKRSS